MLAKLIKNVEPSLRFVLSIVSVHSSAIIFYVPEHVWNMWCSIYVEVFIPIT